MRQIYVATIVGVALLLAAQSAPAQTSVCKTVSGRLVCNEGSRPTGAAGSHAYEQWQGDSQVTAAGSTGAPKPRFRSYIGGYNAGYGFGK